MALGLTQPLVKMSTRNISWGERRPVHEADNITTFRCQMSWVSGSLNVLRPSGPHRACYGIPSPLPLPFFLFIYVFICLFIEVVVIYSEVVQVAWICVDRLRFLSGYAQNVYQKHYLLSSILNIVHDIALKVLHLEVRVLKR
jgi:hypothetical protein